MPRGGACTTRCPPSSDRPRLQCRRRPRRRRARARRRAPTRAARSVGRPASAPSRAASDAASSPRVSAFRRPHRSPPQRAPTIARASSMLTEPASPGSVTASKRSTRSAASRRTASAGKRRRSTRPRSRPPPYSDREYRARFVTAAAIASRLGFVSMVPRGVRVLSLHGKNRGHECRAAVHAGVIEERGDVVLDGARADPELVGDRRCREASRDQCEHRALPWGESPRTRGRVDTCLDTRVAIGGPEPASQPSIAPASRTGDSSNVNDAARPATASASAVTSSRRLVVNSTCPTAFISRICRRDRRGTPGFRRDRARPRAHCADAARPPACVRARTVVARTARALAGCERAADRASPR